MGSSKTYAVNMADKHVTVRSLEVIDGLTGKSVRVIKQQLDALQETNQFQAPKVDYWSQLSDDGLITPVEKKTIKSELANIRAVYIQLETQAQVQSKTEEIRWINYDNVYHALENYLRDVLHIFDDMNVSTAIEDRDQFNEYFAVYYSLESDAQTLLTQGEPGRIRHLTSLYESGLPGEVAVYNNWFYIYNTKWESVPKDDFLGSRDRAPKDPVTNQYFLAKGHAILKELYIGAAGKIVSVAGKKLAVMERGIPGTIYVWDGEQWQPDNDINSYRYMVATNDLIINNYPISEALSTAIQGEAGTNGYLGMFTTDPEITQIKFNSYYVYIGDNTDQRKKGNIYIYRKTGWEELKPEAKNYSYYMFTLNDTLQNNDLPVSAFAGLFAGFIAANNAFIEQLGSKFITLKTGGHIKSEEYDEGEEGFIMKSDGDIQSANFDEDNKTGYKLGKDGRIISNEMIANNMQANGGRFDQINVTSGNFDSINVGGESKFTGEINSGPLILNNNGTPGISLLLNKTSSNLDIYNSIQASEFREGITYNLNETSYYGSTRITKFLWEEGTNFLFITLKDSNNRTISLELQLRTGSKTLGENLYINTAAASDYTLKLINLPVNEPSEVGRVWNDNGVLKIKV